MTRTIQILKISFEIILAIIFIPAYGTKNGSLFKNAHIVAFISEIGLFGFFMLNVNNHNLIGFVAAWGYSLIFSTIVIFMIYGGTLLFSKEKREEFIKNS